MVNQLDILKRAEQLIGKKCQIKMKSGEIISGIMEKIEADSKVTQLRITLLVEENKGLVIPLSKVEELIELG